MSEKSLHDKFMEWENTDDLARICENRAFDTFEGGYILAKKEMIQEIERRMPIIREYIKIATQEMSDVDLAKRLGARYDELESLLSWITEKGTDE